VSHTRPLYPPAFKAEAVQLARSSDKSLGAVAKDLGIADQTLRTWVRQAEIDGGERAGLTQGEREELRRLRRGVRTRRQAREIRTNAAACFARESDAIRSRRSRSSRRRRPTSRWP
jgi:transposase